MELSTTSRLAGDSTCSAYFCSIDVLELISQTFLGHLPLCGWAALLSALRSF